MNNFLLKKFPLKNVWMKETHNIHGLNPKTSLKLLQKFILHNILRLEQITLHNNLNMMDPTDLKNVHSSPTKLI
jgi:hypothetical protein